MNCEERWQVSESYCDETRDKDGRLHYKGSYHLDGVVFTFNVNEQAKGKHILRGQVSVFSQRKGHLMRDRKEKGEEPKVIMRNIYPSPPFGTDRTIWRVFVMGSVEKAAQSLLSEKRHQIKRDAELSITPDSVTPQLALIVWGDSFLRQRHENASQKSREDYYRVLSRFFRILPNKPMTEFRESEITKAIQETHPSRQAIKLAKDFWGYCIDTHQCSGKNPFPVETKKRKSAAAKQAEADRLDILDIEMQDAVYRRALDEPTGANCGVALMLWGGLDAKRACSLLWKDLVFSEDEGIILKLNFEDYAGATHNYSRTLFQQGEAIVKNRYHELANKYGKTRLCTMPIVSIASTPQKSMKPNDLKQYGKAMLKRIGIGQRIIGHSDTNSIEIAARIFENTYAHNLAYRCGLNEDTGLYLFLCGRSLAGNTTADHYRSFTDADGIEAQRSVQRRMAPEKAIKLERAADKSNPEFDSYFFAAPTTQDLINMKIIIKDLPEGEVVSIISRYGGDMHIEGS